MKELSVSDKLFGLMFFFVVSSPLLGSIIKGIYYEHNIPLNIGMVLLGLVVVVTLLVATIQNLQYEVQQLKDLYRKEKED